MAVVDAMIEEKARAAVRVLGQWGHVRAAYLFGSQVDGTADDWSDIDIAVFIDEAKEWDFQQHIDVCVETRRQIGDEIELHVFPADSLQNPPRASFAQYVLQHGRRIDITGINAVSK